MAGVDYSGKAFVVADNVTGRDFTDDILRGCTFRDLDLTGTKFNNAVVRGVLFQNCIYNNTNFTDTELIGSYFSNEVIQTGAIFSPKTEFREATLSGVDFTGNQTLAEINFREADLTDAILKDTDLTNADFRNAWLINTLFENAHLNGAFIMEAIF